LAVAVDPYAIGEVWTVAFAFGSALRVVYHYCATHHAAQLDLHETASWLFDPFRNYLNNVKPSTTLWQAFQTKGELAGLNQWCKTYSHV
jgi:hypothetical protein